MIPPPFREAAFELAKRLSGIERVITIILFGSVARGDADTRSDLDLLLVTERKERKSIKKEINAILHQVGKEHNITIQSIVTDTDFSGLDHNFIDNVMKEGLILYGKQLTVSAGKLQLEPYAFFHYDTKNSAQHIRTKLTRILYGHATEKEYKGRTYTSTSKGILSKYGGWKVGLAAFLVPFKNSKAIATILANHKVQYKKLEVWISKI